MNMSTHKKLFTTLVYSIAAIFIFAILLYLSSFDILRNFLSSIEDKTFDHRQNVLLHHKKHNENIVIIAVDDPSYEYITDNYGTWPVPRSFWGDMINVLEKYEPRLIAFDLLFTKKMMLEGSSDQKLIDAVISNDNVLISMNFDNFPQEVRKPIDLPNYLKNTVKNDASLKNSTLITYSNCRKIMDELLEGTDNIGIINATRDDDGVMRKMPPLFIYKDSYYKHLAFLTALKYLDIETNTFEMTNEFLIINKKHKIPLLKRGEAVLNWYGPGGTFKTISLYQVSEAIKNNDKKFLKDNFKNKLIYIGTTATALSDVKTSPVSRQHPGVEIHTTFVNNVIDNSFIKRTSFHTDLVITFLLCILIGIGVVKSRSVLFTIVETLVVFFGYIVLATFLMQAFNLWIGIVLPITFGAIMFIGCYIVKYLLVYRDYEHTYKLAVTDGLTEMYNHRYFQEQMIAQTNNSKRYEVPFSLILIDIDFFKKFNDTHGHQSGDAVLRQVALAIKKSIRSTDIACRYGGEEMSVILPNTGKDEAVLAAKKIHLAVEQGKFILANGSKTSVTISVGVASMPQDGDAPEKLIEYADKCLYKAKGQGRNQVVSEP